MMCLVNYNYSASLVFSFNRGWYKGQEKCISLE